MGDGNGGREASKRTAKSAGRVALHDQHPGPIGKQGRNCPGNHFDQAVRVFAAMAIEGDALEPCKAVLGHGERVLAGKNEARLQAPTAQRDGDWCKLDRFRTSSDHKVDTQTVQLSP
jgi:hypothetical protein